MLKLKPRTVSSKTEQKKTGKVERQPAFPYIRLINAKWDTRMSSE